MSEQGGLVPSEGVDEGSAASTGEALEQHARDGVDLLGEPPRGAPDGEEQPGEPVDMESPESRSSRDERGTGQQYAEGEG